MYEEWISLFSFIGTCICSFHFLRFKNSKRTHGNHMCGIINETNIQSVEFINVHPNGNVRRSRDSRPTRNEIVQSFRFARFVITLLEVRVLIHVYCADNWGEKNTQRYNNCNKSSNECNFWSCFLPIGVFPVKIGRFLLWRLLPILTILLDFLFFFLRSFISFFFDLFRPLSVDSSF